MEYENRTVAEGINVSDEHPLKEFIILSLSLGIITILFVVVLSFMASSLVHYIPFETEKKLAEQVFTSSDIDNDNESEPLDENAKKIENYLQGLADKLSQAQQLPEGMVITVHYVDSDTVNAFATLGGHIVMFRGLVEKLPHENALSMVMAHEIAHIKHRDPMVALGRGLTVGLALATLSGFGDGDIAYQLLGKIGLITTLSFNRSQEDESDQEALQTLVNHYGHAYGAEELFKVFQCEFGSDYEPPEFLSTHPITKERIEAVENFQMGDIKKSELKNLPAWMTKPKKDKLNCQKK